TEVPGLVCCVHASRNLDHRSFRPAAGEIRDVPPGARHRRHRRRPAFPGVAAPSTLRIACVGRLTRRGGHALPSFSRSRRPPAPPPRLDQPRVASPVLPRLCRLHGNDGVPDRSGPAGRPGALGTHGHDVRRRFVGALPPRPAGGLVPGARLAGVAHCGPGFPAGASGYAGGARAGRNAAAVRKRNAADRLIPHLPTWARHTPGRRHTNPRAAGFTPAKHSPGIFLHLTPKTHKIGGLPPCSAPRASTPAPSVPTPSPPPYIRFPL